MSYKNKTPRMSASVARKRTRVIKPANDNVPEWEIQAESVRRIKRLPGYGDVMAPDVRFTLAADFNAGRRSRQESVKAKATGIAAGEPDLRFYGADGRLLLVELKGPRTPISAEQKVRHELLRGLGFRVEVVRGKTIEQGANDVVALVLEWVEENEKSCN